jgi:hypothetical protein
MREEERSQVDGAETGQHPQSAFALGTMENASYRRLGSVWMAPAVNRGWHKGPFPLNRLRDDGNKTVSFCVSLIGSLYMSTH